MNFLSLKVRGLIHIFFVVFFILSPFSFAEMNQQNQQQQQKQGQNGGNGGGGNPQDAMGALIAIFGTAMSLMASITESKTAQNIAYMEEDAKLNMEKMRLGTQSMLATMRENTRRQEMNQTFALNMQALNNKAILNRMAQSERNQATMAIMRKEADDRRRRRKREFYKILTQSLKQQQQLAIARAFMSRSLTRDSLTAMARDPITGAPVVGNTVNLATTGIATAGALQSGLSVTPVANPAVAGTRFGVAAKGATRALSDLSGYISKVTPAQTQSPVVNTANRAIASFPRHAASVAPVEASVAPMASHTH